MGRAKLFGYNPKVVRDKLIESRNLAIQIQAIERDLIRKLAEIDRDRFYVRFDFKSLTGFCIHNLGFSKTQTQRLVRLARIQDNSGTGTCADTDTRSGARTGADTLSTSTN